MSSAEGNATAQSSWSLLPNDILIRILQARFAEAACADIDEEQDLAVVAAIRACCKAWHASVSGLVTSISAQRFPDGCLKRPLANAFPALACLDFSRMSSLQDADCARLMHAPLRMLTELSINATNLSLHGESRTFQHGATSSVLDSVHAVLAIAWPAYIWASSIGQTHYTEWKAHTQITLFCLNFGRSGTPV